MSSLETLPVTIYFGICAVVGIVGNFIMIIVTIKSRKLRSSCNLIVAIACFWDAAHLSGHIPLISGYFKEFVIPQRTCFHWMILPVLGVFSCAPLVLSLAIDRLIAIRFPSWYNNNQKSSRYAFLLFVIPVTLMAFQLIATIRTRTNILLPCNIVSAFSEPQEKIYAKTSIAVYSLVAIVYGLIIYFIYNKRADSKFTKVFKPITIQIFFVFTCWLINVATTVISPFLAHNPEYLCLIYLYGGIPINTAIASNFFVFYKFSGLYRAEINRLFERGGNKTICVSTVLHL